jgi:hypothetical protein
MAIPGTPGRTYTADGLEHSEAGVPSSQARDHRRQLDKRCASCAARLRQPLGRHRRRRRRWRHHLRLRAGPVREAVAARRERRACGARDRAAPARPPAAAVLAQALAA